MTRATVSSLSSYPATRQHQKKLAEDIFKTSKQYFFKLSTVQLWKSFSQDAVEAKSLPRLKEQLERKTHWELMHTVRERPHLLFQDVLDPKSLEAGEGLWRSTTMGFSSSYTLSLAPLLSGTLCYSDVSLAPHSASYAIQCQSGLDWLAFCKWKY